MYIYIYISSMETKEIEREREGEIEGERDLCDGCGFWVGLFVSLDLVSRVCGTGVRDYSDEGFGGK